MRNRLLVVDGEPTSLRVLDVSLRGAGFDVKTATDGLQAWASLQDAIPDLVLCDTDLRGLDGFDLCARVRSMPAGAELPVLLISASRDRDQKIRALEAGADDFLVKPAYIKEVLARVRALLQRRARDALTVDEGAVTAAAASKTSGHVQTPFAGDLSDITVVDLVQLIEGNGRSGIVHLRGNNDSPAFLYFRDGKVVDAEAGRLSGLDALSRLFSWTAGTFEIEWKNIRRKDAIERPSSELVLDGMQRLDAWNELREQLGDLNAVLEVDYRLLAERLAEIPDELNGLLRLCDGVRTVIQVVEDSPLPDTEALTALLRLRAEGIVRDRGLPVIADGRNSSLPPDEQSAAPSSPLSAAPSGPNRSSPIGTRPVEQSFAARLVHEAQMPPPVPDSPRRTAPGLGHPSPLAADAYPQTIPAAPDRSDVDQDNVIQFPAPPAGFAPNTEARPAPHATPTLVGFEPATVLAEPPAALHGPPATSLAPAPLTVDPSMTLPLGLAQEAATVRDQLFRDFAAAGNDALAEADAAAETTALPTDAAPMTDTHPGVGPLPGHHESPPLELPSLAAIPVEIAESSSGAARRSDRVSAPVAIMPASRGRAGDSGRAPSSRHRRAVPNDTVAGETSARVSVPRESSASHAVPRPGDATVKVTFADGDISRRDALDELGLPSRWRGFRVLIGASIVGALAAVGVSRVLNGRGHHEGTELGTGAATQATVPFGSATEGQPGTPAAPSEPTAAVTPPKTAPAVELPTPTAVAAPPAGERTTEEGHRGGEKASEPVTEQLNAAAPPVAAKTGPIVVAAPVVAAPVRAAPPPPEPPPVVAGAVEKAPAARTGGRELAECRSAFAKNRLREALAACTAAAAANPRSAEALAMLAHTELNRGRLTRANELAEKAVAIDPTLADAYVIIGGVHQDSGQNREAKAAYRRYLELAPRGRYADDLRSIVNGL